MDSVNANYARVALLKIEEFEKKNVPISLAKVTVEHLMPQKLSEWWVKHLGGKEESERIYEKYISCIGNLAPVSQGYNSAMSNKKWSEKVVHIKNVQFAITSEIADNAQWKEEDIKRRNLNIADRVCKATISPLERTRKYQTKNSSSDFEAGVYALSDTSTSMNGIKPDSIIYEDKIIKVYTWKDFLCNICKFAHEYDNSIFENIVAENMIHKATSTKNYPSKDPIITKEKSKLVEAKEIENTSYFSEGAISSMRARVYAKQLLDIYGLTDKFFVSIGQ